MSDPADQAKAQHESNKLVRRALAFAHYKLQYMPFLLEESADAKLAVDVLFNMCNDLQKRIEEVEPPAPKEEVAPAKPYVMDLSHVKPKQEAEASV